MKRIKVESSYVVQIRERVRPYVERAQQRYYEEHQIILSATDLITKVLIEHFKQEEQLLEQGQSISISDQFEAPKIQKQYAEKKTKANIVNRAPRKKLKSIRVGRYEFSPTHIEIFTNYRPHLNGIQIAEIMKVSPTTVRTGIRVMKSLFLIDDATEVQRKMVELGVVPESVLEKETQPTAEPEEIKENLTEVSSDS